MMIAHGGHVCLSFLTEYVKNVRHEMPTVHAIVQWIPMGRSSSLMLTVAGGFPIFILNNFCTDTGGWFFWEAKPKMNHYYTSGKKDQSISVDVLVVSIRFVLYEDCRDICLVDSFMGRQCFPMGHTSSSSCIHA